MLRTLSRAAGFALSVVTAMTMITPIEAGLPYPAGCNPNCQQWEVWNTECKYWFGVNWYYCGYNAGWVYCCFNY